MENHLPNEIVADRVAPETRNPRSFTVSYCVYDEALRRFEL